jgi:hypothetical protein
VVFVVVSGRRSRSCALASARRETVVFGEERGGAVMGRFEDIHRDRICGSLTMFDRLIFKGHLTRLYVPGAVRALLWSQGVPMTSFAGYVRDATDALIAHAEAIAREAGRPSIYLQRSTTRDHGRSKEAMAREIAARDGITEGLVCVLRAVEPCRSFAVRKSGESLIDVVPATRQCLRFYFYVIDPEFGFMHVRLQSWLPFEIQVYVNGREWLARQLDATGVGYLRQDNALLRIDDLDTACELCDRFAHRAWPRLLNAFARWANPHLHTIEEADFGGYYWVLDQAEVATDVMFRDRPTLAAVMPDLVRHATLHLSSADVLHFLGRKLHPSLAAEVLTDAKRRPEGWRVKHRLARNWIKAYDKASVLRVETTINNPREFRVLRIVTDDNGRRERRWRPMNKGVCNMWRYFQVGIGANRRYLEALAAAQPNGEGVAALDALCRSRNRNGRHHARFNPLHPADLALFRAVLAGGNTIVGFRNHDLVHHLYPRPPANDDERRRRCARTARLIAKLRGHGLCAKVRGARLYRVTPHGQRVLAAALAIHDEHFPAAYLS